MKINSIDNENNLYRVENVFSTQLVDSILNTDWLDLDWERQKGQEQWSRRLIKDHAVTWLPQWEKELQQHWSKIESAFGKKIQPYCGTAFWVDEPGFVCPLHTDGELPGSLHLNWIGPGTAFYWYKDIRTIRYQTPSSPNSGYIMNNTSDDNGYRRLLWHAMLEPVVNFRVTSYTWIIPAN